jgi:hypothetical protein
MAVGLPLKTTYANGDVYSASDVNDTNGTINTTAAPYAAGKNKFINGDFFINQRGFTSTTTTGTYGLDRWFLTCADGTVTYSVQAFTPGAAPVVGYESANFARVVTTGQTLSSASARLRQSIENVRTFAAQTITVSFWAKSATGTPKVALEFIQNFGTGGSPSSNVTHYAGQATIGTTWQRYSVTTTIPSISGKTVGSTANTSALEFLLYVSAGSNFDARTGTLGIQSNTFDIWGVQIEAGSTATAFQTATGTIGGELALCQRYFQAYGTGENQYEAIAPGSSASTTLHIAYTNLLVSMRVAPSLSYSALADFEVSFPGLGGAQATSISLQASTAGKQSVNIAIGTGALAGSGSQKGFVFETKATAGRLYLSSEL